MTQMLFQGSMTAIITPFRNGRVDENCLRSLIDWQISNGTDAIVPCGTTGEAATINDKERDRIVRIAVEQSSGRAFVLAGAGSNSTDAAISLSRLVKKAGADGMLHVTPYYNKPTQEGLYKHFLAIAELVDLPMVLYNVPGRTGVNMQPETTIRLSSIDTIVGIKEASGNLDQIKRIAAARPPGFSILSGEDTMNLEIYRAGGNGCISVTANVKPDTVSAVWDNFREGNDDASSALQDGLSALNEAMFFETNPIPVKTALAMMGRCEEEFRLPLTPMAEENRERLLKVLKSYKLIS